MRNLFLYSKQKTKAQAIVEFALALPVLLLLLFGMMETGRLLFIYASTVSAARQAARYGSATGISSSGKPYYQDCSGIEAAARRLGFLINFTNINIGFDSGVVDTNGNGIIEANETIDLNPVNPACGAFTTAQNGHRIKVTVTAQWVPIVPLVPLQPFVITSSSERTILASVNIGVTGVAPTYVPTNGAPGLSISPSPTTFDTLNQAISYTYTLTNVGLTNLAGPFAITDPAGKVTPLTCPASPASLAASQTYVCTGTYNITQADLNAGFVTNVATGTPSSSASNTIYATQNATISLVKTATPVVSGNVTYTYVLTNTGNVTMNSYSIADDKLGAITSCTGSTTIEPLASVTCTMAHSVTPTEVSAGTLTNIATANAIYQKYVLGSLVDTSITATSTATVYTSDLTMVIIGTVATTGEVPPAYNAQTQTITYTFNVSNHGAGPLTLSGISINSFSGLGVIPSITCTGVIAAGTTKSCTAAVPYAVVQADIDNVNATTGANIPITITATATAGAFTAQATTAVDPERHPVVSLASNPTPNVASALNTQITYNYTITNSGNTTLSAPVGGFTVADTNGGLNITCATPTATIAPGGTKLCTGVRFISQADLDAGVVLGQASTSAVFGITTYAAIPVVSQVVTFPASRLKLEITVPALIVSGAGASINYTYTLTNTGGANLTGLAILPGYRGSTPVCAATALGLGASTTCTGTYVTTSTDVGTSIVNTATATSTNVNSDPASVTVSVIPPTACILTHTALDLSVPFGMTINNLNNYAVTVSQVEVYFDTTANPAPEIQQVSFGGAVVWTGSDQTGHLTFSASTIIPASGASIVATTSWKHPYVPNGSERIVVHFASISGFTCPDMDSDIAATVPNADLAITKTDGISLVPANSTTTYTITVINNGPGAITSAILSDPAATGLSKASIACSGTSQCVTPPTIAQLESGTFALPLLAAGQSYQIAVKTDVIIGGGNVSNTATIAVPVGAIEAVPGNNSATDSDSVSSPIADMHITKDNGTTSVASGASTVYTITVTNGGPSTVVTGARLTDAFATGLSKTTVVCSLTPGQCVTPPTAAQLESGAFQLPTLAVGQTYQIKVTATVTALSGTSVNNVAKVDLPAGTTDPISGDNSKTKTDTVTASNPPVDLSITKTDGVTTINTGGVATYTIVVTNSAANPADGAIFTDPLIAGLNVATGGSVTCGIVTGGAVCPTVGNTTVALMQGAGIVIPTMPASSSIRFTVTGTVTATSGTLANAAKIAAPANRTDTNIANNDATDPADTVNPVDLAITKTDGVTAINTGNVATYTIVVTNSGPASATGAKFTDPSISGLDVTTSGSVTCSGAACPTVGNTTVALMQGAGIVIPTLTSGSSVTFTVKGKVTAVSGVITNSAQITAASTNTETNSANNTATDLADTVTVPVCTTGDVTYTLTAVNGDSFVTWSVNNNLGISLPITSINLAWSGAGVGASNYQLNSIGFTSTGTSFTSGIPPLTGASISSGSYTTGTGTLGSGISAFTITFSKQNPTVTGITITFASPHGACTHTSTPAVP